MPHVYLLVILLHMDPSVFQIVEEHPTMGECFSAMPAALAKINQQNPSKEPIDMDRLGCMDVTLHPSVEDQADEKTLPPE